LRAQQAWPTAVAAVRFLALTGWRKGEAGALEWRDVDFARRTAVLPDTKTGRSIRPLSRAACDVLRGMPRLGDAVFPATRAAGQIAGLRSLWAHLISSGALAADIVPHVLRHSFASTAADLGYADLTIAAMLGHSGRTMTSRYTHTADTVLLAATDAVGRRVAELMGDDAVGEVVPLAVPPRAAVL
jgi:integrase